MDTALPLVPMQPSKLSTTLPLPDNNAVLLDGADMQRQESNVSSTSSDILVLHPPAPIPENGSHQQVVPDPPAVRRAWTENARTLVIKLAPERLHAVLSVEPRPCIPPVFNDHTIPEGYDDKSNEKNDSFQTHLDDQEGLDTGSNDADDKGPNARGTYSKEYILRHPEIAWVHRGQGRYLPSSAVKVHPPPTLRRASRQSRSGLSETPGLAHGVESQPQDNSFQPSKVGRVSTADEGSSPAPGHHRKRRAVEDTLADSLTPAPVYGLRHRRTEPDTPKLYEQRSARLARRAKSFPSAEYIHHHNLPTSFSDSDHENQTDTDTDSASGKKSDSESASDGETDDMADGKAETFTKEYVEAHPDQVFYHTGNNYYKRGKRPKGPTKRSKPRESEDGVYRRPDGSWAFDREKTIHSSQLYKFPGFEFHHAGNSWYKPGPALSEKRTSITVPFPTGQGRDNHGLEAEQRAEAASGKPQTVSKEYALQHPETIWEHRGKGRYAPKKAVKDATSSPSAHPGRYSSKGLDMTYDRTYVDSHPDEIFYHTGNGRWKRGFRPTPRVSTTRDEIQDAVSDTLYDRAYVEKHRARGEEFHHRGQGRWARGPKPVIIPVPDDEDEDDEDEDDTDDDNEDADEDDEGLSDPERLVDTAYVEAHPNLTFYHKGQGRWARGLPPPGSSNKMAIRGPSFSSRTGRLRIDADEDEGDEDDEVDEDDDDEEEREEEEEKEDEVEANGMTNVPAKTALVVKSEGPDKWPNLKWHYRGGGKWGRMTKIEWERHTSGVQAYEVTTFSRYKGKTNTNSSNGLRSQLMREAATATRAKGDHDQSLFQDGYAAPMTDKQQMKRRRISRRAADLKHEDSKLSSKSQSQAPTPKPQLLTADEDVLGPDDLPELYRGSWSPAELEDEDPAAKLYRANFQPLNINALLKSLTKHDPAVRPTENLLSLAAHGQAALKALQDEYLELEKITAPHSRIPRKQAKGGRVPIDPQIFEDKKEAELYDYAFDPRKIGFQDPTAQKIVRDAEGRELRKRRNRNGGTDVNGTVPGWDFGDKPEPGSKRQSRQPTRFDGSVASASRKGMLFRSKAESQTPDHVATSNLSYDVGQQLPNGYQVPTTGRWAGHIPKRIRELRDESVASVRGEGDGEPKVRKGRPPGSKNLHKRKDAGIKKGPRKPKTNSAPGSDGHGDFNGREAGGAAFGREAGEAIGMMRT